MRANKKADICDPEVITHKYEMLRANALGSMNRASGLTVFLRNGMSAWMRAIGGQDSAPGKIRQQTSYAFTELEVDMPAAGLASILTDAILNAARPAIH